MEKQLINLALLNGGSLSEKTKTNLDLYLRTKLQSAGSTDLSVSGDQDQEQPGYISSFIGGVQNLNSRLAQTATGIDIDEINAQIDNLNTLFGLFGASQEEIEALRDEVGNEFGEITESINDLERNVAKLKQRLDRGDIESQKLSESLALLGNNIQVFLTEIIRLNQKIEDEETRAKAAEKKEVLRATAAEKKEIQKRAKVTQEEAKIRKQQNVKLTKRLQKAEQKVAENKRDLTSSIEELSTSVKSLKADYQTQGVINQEMVDVLRKLNKQNIESQEKFRKLKKTPFGAII